MYTSWVIGLPPFDIFNLLNNLSKKKSHVTCLNNTCGWFYKSPRNKLKENPPSWFGGKLYPKIKTQIKNYFNLRSMDTFYGTGTGTGTVRRYDNS